MPRRYHATVMNESTDSAAASASEAAHDPSPSAPRRFWTVPNVICLARLVGSPLLVVFAWLDRPGIVVGLLVAGLLGDWVDGKIARWLNQRSAIGPALDTAADVVMYTALAGAVVVLRDAFVVEQLGWFLAVGATYALSVGVGWVRFRRWPTYHTRAAKICWLLVGIAAICLLLDGPRWPFYLAAAGVILTNLEATAIGLMIDQPRSDVPSILSTRRHRLPDADREATKTTPPTEQDT